MNEAINTSLGQFFIYKDENSGWSFSTTCTTIEAGVDVINILLSPENGEEKVPPKFTLYSKCENIRPSNYRWTPLSENMCMPPDGLCEVYSELAWSVPVSCAIGEHYNNTAAVTNSAALR